AVRRHGGLSRSGLARLSGLSKGSVTAIAQQLLRQGLLIEGPGGAAGRDQGDGASRRLGRPGVRLTLNPDFASAVGLEISGSRVDALVLDLRGDIRGRDARTLTSTASPEDVLAAAGEAVAGAVAAAGDAGRRVRGVGVAVPGIVDARRGVSLWIPGLVR